MMDIKTLVSAMRHCVETCDCVTCPVDIGHGRFCITRLFSAAADAIEELYGYAKRLKTERLVSDGNGGFVRESRWIPVTEAFPGDGKYLVLYANGNVDIDEYMTFPNGVGNRLHPKGKWYCEFDDWGGITHWMPLPTPPKEEA